MPVFNYPKKEVNVKVVYYGPGLSGKTTNLQKIHDGIKPDFRGKLISLATQTDRTLFFDFMPMELGSLGGYKIRLHLYTVPGQVHYNATRKLVLKNVDGVVFVADSQKAMNDANIESVLNLEKNLQSYGKSLSELPHIIQANKRDLDDVISLEEIGSLLNHHGAAITEAVASEGTGVLETLTEIVRLVMKELREQFSSGSPPIGEPSKRPAHEPENGHSAAVASREAAMEQETTGDQARDTSEQEPETEPEPGSSYTDVSDSDQEAVAEEVDTGSADKPELGITPDPEAESGADIVPEVELIPDRAHEPLPEVELDAVPAPANDPKEAEGEPGSPEKRDQAPGAGSSVKVLVPVEGVGTLELSISINARMLEKGEVRTIDLGVAVPDGPYPASGSAFTEASAVASTSAEAMVDKEDMTDKTTDKSDPAPEPADEIVPEPEPLPASEDGSKSPSSSVDLPPLSDDQEEPLGPPLDGQEPDDVEISDLPGEDKILLDDDLETSAGEPSLSKPAAGYDPTVPSMDFDFPETGHDEEPPKKGLFGRLKKK